jgi:VanZ family protein
MKNLKKYLGKLYLAIGWSVIIFILLSLPGSMIPKEPSFILPGFDKLVHIGLFGGFVLLWCFYYSSKSLSIKKQLRVFFFIFLISSCYGIAMEYVQKYFIPMRDFDVADILADLMGAGLAYGICNISLIE